MTTYYIGPGGSDSNNGESWALRCLTLYEIIANKGLAAGDDVIIGPGINPQESGGGFDVDGTSGSPIRFIGDVSGELTDGIGGAVILTGSSDYGKTNDQDDCFWLNGYDYYEFYNLTFVHFDTGILADSGETGIVVEDCVFYAGTSIYSDGIYVSGYVAGASIEVRRCAFLGMESGIVLYNSTTEVTSTITIENCYFSSNENALLITGPNTATVRHCTFFGNEYAMQVGRALTANTIDVEYCIFGGNENAVYSSTNNGSYGIQSDYNAVDDTNVSSYNNVAIGTNDTDTQIPKQSLLLKDGYNLHGLTQFFIDYRSPLLDEMDDGGVTDDLFGIGRPPSGSGMDMPGPVQSTKGLRETTTKNIGASSYKMEDAGNIQIRVPVQENMRGTSITVSVKVYREANYAGTNPQMITREPGQADDTKTDTGSTATWNTLTRTFTPQSTTHVLIVELRSNNTASSGSFATYFDTLEVD